MKTVEGEVLGGGRRGLLNNGKDANEWKVSGMGCNDTAINARKKRWTVVPDKRRESVGVMRNQGQRLYICVGCLAYRGTHTLHHNMSPHSPVSLPPLSCIIYVILLHSKPGNNGNYFPLPCAFYFPCLMICLFYFFVSFVEQFFYPFLCEASAINPIW